MTRNIYAIEIPYGFNPAHKGAPYTFDGGVKYCNGGDAHEIWVKACKGYVARKDGNTTYDKGSDIPELNASVKSSGATLVNKFLGHNLETTLVTYFATTHSSMWIWAVKIDETLTTYEMNRAEFEEFTTTWAGYDASRKVVRFKKTSGKMIKWLEERVEG